MTSPGGSVSGSQAAMIEAALVAGAARATGLIGTGSWLTDRDGADGGLWNAVCLLVAVRSYLLVLHIKPVLEGGCWRSRSPLS